MIDELVAFGDVYVDIVADLAGAVPPVELRSLTSSSNCFCAVETQAGGTALHAALAARAAGFGSATIIGMVGSDGDGDGGPDPDGAYLERHASRAGVEPLLVTTSNRPTGRVVIVYTPDGDRLMISDRGANEELTAGDVTPEMLAAVRRASALHLSGYALLQPARREALALLAEEARDAGTMVGLDFAPHDLHRFLTREELVDATAPLVDCAFVELPLAERVRTGRAFDRTAADPDASLAWWSTHFDHVVLHLTPERALVSGGGAVREVESLYRAGPESRGQSEVVQAEILAGLCGCAPGRKAIA